MPDGPIHANQTGANLHVASITSDTDPGAIGAGKRWTDTSAGTGNYVEKERNAANDGWETLGGGSEGGDADVVPYTDDYTVQVSDSRKILTMANGASKTFSLPSVGSTNIGLSYTFVRLGAGALVIDAADSDTIMDSDAGATLYNAVADEAGLANVTVVLVTETTWLVTGGYGTWLSTGGA